jgi:hypothetical protein
MKEVYKFESHSKKHRKNLSWPVCEKCGLIYLKNNFTAWAIKNGCNSNDHPDYEKQRAKT